MSKEQRLKDLQKEVDEKGYMNLKQPIREEYTKLKDDLKPKKKTDPKPPSTPVAGADIKKGDMVVKDPEGEVIPAAKEEVEVDDTPQPVDPGNQDDSSSEPEPMVPMSMVQKLVNESIENYRKQRPPAERRDGDWEEVKPDKRRNQTATLRLYRKDTKSEYGAIVRADFIRMEWDEETHKYEKMIYEIEVLYDDDTTEVLEITSKFYTELNQREKVELVKVDRKEQKKVIGRVSRPRRDKDGFPIHSANDDGYGGYDEDRPPAGEVDISVTRFREIFTVKRPSGQTFKIHARYLNG